MRIVFTLLLLGTNVAFAQTPQPQPSVADYAAEMLKKLIALGPSDANAVIMDSTFHVGCEISSGTAFILAQENESKKLRYVLVTAHHVLFECMAGGSETMKITLRYRSNDPLKWEVKVQTIKIAVGGRALWVTHPSADVAALSIEVPDGVIKTPLLIGILADAETLKKQLYLGRDVFALGYPYGGPGLLSGFPILRPAQVASRMIDDKNVIALSFNIYPGDSGGPVYVVDRSDGNLGVSIIGLMIQAVVNKANAVQAGTTKREIWSLVGVGYIATSTEIRETLKLLPAMKK